MGSLPAIFASVAVIALWAVSGPVFGFSNTWQLAINTGTTIITFNMVFVIQNTNNRDGRASQVKLDAILQLLDPDCTNPEVRRLLGLEERPDAEIKREQDQLHAIGGSDGRASGDSGSDPGAGVAPQ